ncbi:hypothetical protein LCGC14_2156090 [marine sediment metagenome]|uniref:Uncharacterized protein n=1 Tax=marine sediment metagenome TaxID=412755 RepID=A0A0F9G783_9ZZZZ
MANQTVLPSVGSLTITLTDATFINSSDSKMVIIGQPLTVTHLPRLPGVGSAAITGQQVTRAFGLRLAGQGISGGIAHNRSTGVASLSISSDVPQTVIASPPSKTLAPTTGSVGISSDVITIQVLSITPDTASMSLLGIAPTVVINNQTIILDGTFAGLRSILSVESDAPTISLDYVGGGPTDGVQILNPNATTDSLNRYNICARTGFRQKPGTLVKDGYGEMVRPEAQNHDMQERGLRASLSLNVEHSGRNRLATRRL